MKIKLYRKCENNRQNLLVSQCIVDAYKKYSEIGKGEKNNIWEWNCIFCLWINYAFMINHNHGDISHQNTDLHEKVSAFRSQVLLLCFLDSERNKLGITCSRTWIFLKKFSCSMQACKGENNIFFFCKQHKSTSTPFLTVEYLHIRFPTLSSTVNFEVHNL